MLTESTRKLRDPLAFGLLAAAALYLLSVLALLFKDYGDLGDRAFYLQSAFADPVWVLVILAAVALVTLAGERSPQARTVTMVALALLGAMLLLGALSWLIGYGGDDFSLLGAGKITGTFLAIARLLVVGVAAFLTFHLFTSMPAPERQQPHAQQGGQWGGQQGPYGSQGGQQGQWGAPAVGGAAWGQQASGQSSSGYAAGAEQAGQWGQQHDPYAQPQAYGQQPPTLPDQQAGSYAGGEQPAWGQQQDPYAPPQASGQSSSGYAAGGEQPSWGQPADEQQQAWGQPQQQAWGQPQQEQQAWGQPEQEPAWVQPEQEQQPDGAPADQQPQGTWEEPSREVDPDATVIHDAHAIQEAAAQQRDPDPDDQAREDDQRPGWWAPGS